MKRNQFSLLALFCLFAGICFSQNISPTWTAYTQGTGDNSDRFNKIIPDGAGNFIAVGYTIKPGNYRDFLTVKLNSNGDTLWWRTKNGKNSKEDEALTVDIDAAGNVYVAGYSDAGLTEDDIMLVKYNASGVAIWDTLWNSPYSMNDAPVELHVDINNNIYIAGNAKPDTTAGNRDIVVLKYSPDGGLEASYIYNNQSVVGGKDEAAGMDIGLDGNIYVTGRTYNGVTDDYITLKFHADTLGMPMWIRLFDGGNNDRANDIAVDLVGSIIITGQSTNANNNYDIRTIKYDSTGIFVWTKFFNAPTNQDDIGLFIGIDASNNVIIGGETDAASGFLTDMNYQVLKYNSAGTLQWQAQQGNVVSQDDHPNALAVDGNGNIFLTGRSDQNNTPLVSDDDFMTVMYNSSGNLQWGGPLYYAGTRTGDDDIASSIIVDGIYIYVAGGAENLNTHKDATIVKYEISSGTKVWDINYNGEGDMNESAKAIVVDLNNYSYAAGYAFSEKHNLDACISKIDPTGNVVCTYKYQGIKGDDDEFEEIAISVNGFVYATGYTRVTDQKRNLLLVKWDPSTCDTVWTRTYDYGIAQSDRGESLVVDVMGNIYVTGRSDANPVDSSENNDIITMKFDSNGNMVWPLQRYNGSGNLKDEPVKIIFDNNGDILVAGQTENVHDDDIIVLKYTTSGMMVPGFPVIYGGPFSNDDRATDIAVDNANNIFVSGYMQTQSGNAPQDPVVLKYDAAGNLLGLYPTFGNDKDEPARIAIDSQNDVYILYKYDADGLQDTSANYDFLLKKLNNTLDSIYFEKQYDSPINGDDLPSDMFIGPSGDVYITGSSENDSSANRFNKNWVTIGYDDSGIQIFISNWDGPNATDDSPNAITIRGSILWVAGNSEGANNNKDLTVNNYDIINISVNEIDKTAKANVFPNPFHDQCEILLNDDIAAPVATLEVFDMLGNSVVLPQAFIGRSVKFSRGNLAPGIYEFRIKNSSNILANGKLIIN